MHRNDGTNHIHDLATKQVYASFLNNPLAMCWHKKLLSMSWHSALNAYKYRRPDDTLDLFYIFNILKKPVSLSKSVDFNCSSRANVYPAPPLGLQCTNHITNWNDE